MDESMALRTDVHPSPRPATPSCPPPTHTQSVRNICCDQWVSSSVSNSLATMESGLGWVSGGGGGGGQAAAAAAAIREP